MSKLRLYSFRIKPIIVAKIRKKFLLLSFLVAVFLLCIIMATANGEDTAISTFSEVHHPIKSVQTETNSFSLTVNISTHNRERDIRLLCDVCKGLDVSVCFFVTVEQLDENIELIEYISRSGHYLGLYIKEDMSEYSRSEIMRQIAQKNDKFFTKTQRYPKYVRLEQAEDVKSSEVLNAYCQYNIDSNIAITEDNTDLIKAGDIVEIATMDSNAPYLAAKFLAKAIKKDLKPVSLKELLYDIESEVDANGRQCT